MDPHEMEHDNGFKAVYKDLGNAYAQRYKATLTPYLDALTASDKTKHAQQLACAIEYALQLLHTIEDDDERTATAGYGELQLLFGRVATLGAALRQKATVELETVPVGGQRPSRRHRNALQRACTYLDDVLTPELEVEAGDVMQAAHMTAVQVRDEKDCEASRQWLTVVCVTYGDFLRVQGNWAQAARMFNRALGLLDDECAEKLVVEQKMKMCVQDDKTFRALNEGSTTN